LFPRRFGRGRRLRAVVILECGLHPRGSAGQIFGMFVQVHEHTPNVERSSAKFAIRGRKRWTARTSRCGDWRGKMNGVQAASSQRLVRILQEPRAVVPVENEVCG